MAQKVKFKRHTTAEIEELEVEDGALVYNIDNGKTYMDYGTERIQTGGNADTMISIGDEEPTDEDIKIWINTPTSETKASEIVNEYTDSDKVGYSTRYMNTALLEPYSTDEVKTNKVWVDGKPIYRKIVVYDKGTRTGKIETNHGISDVDKIVSIGGFVTNNTEFIPLPSAITIDNVNPYSISLQTSTRTKFTIFVGTVFTTSWTFYIITEYTKTTDQGGV